MALSREVIEEIYQEQVLKEIFLKDATRDININTLVDELIEKWKSLNETDKSNASIEMNNPDISSEMNNSNKSTTSSETNNCTRSSEMNKSNISIVQKNEIFKQIYELDIIYGFCSILPFKAFQNKCYDLLDRYMALGKQYMIMNLIISAGITGNEHIIKQAIDYSRTMVNDEEAKNYNFNEYKLCGLARCSNYNLLKPNPQDYNNMEEFKIVLYNIITFASTSNNELFDKIESKYLEMYTTANMSNNKHLYCHAAMSRNKFVMNKLERLGLKPPVESLAHLFSCVYNNVCDEAIEYLSLNTKNLSIDLVKKLIMTIFVQCNKTRGRKKIIDYLLDKYRDSIDINDIIDQLLTCKYNMIYNNLFVWNILQYSFELKSTCKVNKYFIQYSYQVLRLIEYGIRDLSSFKSYIYDIDMHEGDRIKDVSRDVSEDIIDVNCGDIFNNGNSDRSNDIVDNRNSDRSNDGRSNVNSNKSILITLFIHCPKYYCDFSTLNIATEDEIKEVKYMVTTIKQYIMSCVQYINVITDLILFYY